jgi:hypothetical protein
VTAAEIKGEKKKRQTAPNLLPKTPARFNFAKSWAGAVERETKKCQHVVGGGEPQRQAPSAAKKKTVHFLINDQHLQHILLSPTPDETINQRASESSFWHPVRGTSPPSAAPARAHDGAVTRPVAHGALVLVGSVAVALPQAPARGQKPCRPHVRIALEAAARETLGPLGVGREFIPAGAFEMRDAVKRRARPVLRRLSNFGQEGPGPHPAVAPATVKCEVRRAFGGRAESVAASAFKPSARHRFTVDEW